MLIKVTPHIVKIIKEQSEPINEKEINVSKCQFEFSEEIENDYVKEAYFTLNGNTYKQIIVNNECDYPGEVLEQKGELEIGVVVFKIENEEYVKLYNPTPDYYETWIGSLKEAENSEPITPSDKEQIEQAILNLQNNKQDTLVSGENIKTLNNESLLGSGNIEIEVDLSDYYTKEETYSKAEVNNLIPTTLSELQDDANHRLVSDIEKETWNSKIDSSALIGYVKNTDYANNATGGVIKTNGTYSLGIYQGSIYPITKTYSQYESLDNNAFIGKGTLEAVITGKELVNKTYVDNLVGDIETILTTLDVGGGISGN